MTSATVLQAPLQLNLPQSKSSSQLQEFDSVQLATALDLRTSNFHEEDNKALSRESCSWDFQAK